MIQRNRLRTIKIYIGAVIVWCVYRTGVFVIELYYFLKSGIPMDSQRDKRL